MRHPRLYGRYPAGCRPVLLPVGPAATSVAQARERAGWLEPAPAREVGPVELFEAATRLATTMTLAWMGRAA